VPAPPGVCRAAAANDANDATSMTAWRGPACPRAVERSHYSRRGKNQLHCGFFIRDGWRNRVEPSMKRRHPRITEARQACKACEAGHPPALRRKKSIMQVRQALLASLLAVTAVGAMSQELDPSETLQGKSLAAQREQAARARQSAAAETRNLAAAGQAKAEAANAAADAQVAQARTRAASESTSK
jgi:hypothetical protein